MRVVFYFLYVTMSELAIICFELFFIGQSLFGQGCGTVVCCFLPFLHVFVCLFPCTLVATAARLTGIAACRSFIVAAGSGRV